jgi:hypothetical protein
MGTIALAAARIVCANSPAAGVAAAATFAPPSVQVRDGVAVPVAVLATARAPAGDSSEKQKGIATKSRSGSYSFWNRLGNDSNINKTTQK